MRYSSLRVLAFGVKVFSFGTAPTMAASGPLTTIPIAGVRGTE